MKTAKRHLVIGSNLLSIVVFACLAMPARRAAAAEDPTGNWEMKVDLNGRETFASLSIKKKPDGSLTGKWGSTEISDVKMDGDKLTFVRTLKFGDNEFKTTFEGKLKDGKLEGTLSSDRGNATAVGSRKKPKSPILGRWDLKYTIGDRDMEAKLDITQKPDGSLEGKWSTGANAEHVVSNVKFQDGKLTLDRKTKIGDREFESTYQGAVQGSKINGTIKGQFGEVPANGQRLGGDLVGTWELSSTSDRGPRTNLLTISGDLTGRYEVFGSEVPIQDLKVDGSQVAFTAEVGFGNQTSKIDFKGKLDGSTLKGEVTSPRGTREVTGKKLEESPDSPAASKPSIAGTWEITRQGGGQRGPTTATLKINDDMTATYTARDNTVKVTDLRLEGDQLSFKVTMKFNDREVPMEFKGMVEGTNLKGEFITARGSREATGKKVNTVSL